jgi:hypothetical protein
MAKKPLNQGKPWTNEDMSELDMLAQQNTPSRRHEDGPHP